MSSDPTQEQLQLPPELVEALQAQIPEVADAAVTSIIAEVPAYARAFSGAMGEVIRNAVALALGGFVQMGLRGIRSTDQPAAASLQGAYQLGRGEARSGRSMEALLAAYRVGSRVSWRQMAVALVEGGADPATVAAYAELVFAYMDQLSDASTTGHRDEITDSGRARQQLLDALARSLVEGASAQILTQAAERAEWEHPDTLTAIVVPEAHAAHILALVAETALRVDDPVIGSERTVLMVPDAHRSVLLRTITSQAAIIGPARPWTEVRSSYLRALRALELPQESRRTALDTEAHLGALVLGADPEALRDLRAQVLAPLTDSSESTQEKLTETLRTWLLHQGRRDTMAQALFVHPQTVRYRMGQLRELYGDRLDDPDFVRDATVALA